MLLYSMALALGCQTGHSRENHESSIAVKLSLMFTLTQLKRLATALLAVMLLAVSAPTISKVIVMDGSQSALIEICTTEGVKRISFSDSALSAKQPLGEHSAHAEDCPYCHLQSTQSIPPAALTFLSVPVLAFFPSLFYQAPKSQFAWAPQRARAPPVLS
jgi:hypothetical protein